MDVARFRWCLAHPNVGLDARGLAKLLGLNDRFVRRWGTKPENPVPAEVAAWLEERVVSTGPKPSYSAWLNRRPGSNPPPLPPYAYVGIPGTSPNHGTEDGPD